MLVRVRLIRAFVFRERFGLANNIFFVKQKLNIKIKIKGIMQYLFWPFAFLMVNKSKHSN